MRYVALAADYDATIASDGAVSDHAADALVRLDESGRRLILVTGRLLEDLLDSFDRFDLFDRIVAENGAVLYDPQTEEARTLTEPPPEAFVDALRDEGVEPLSVGRVVVATEEPHQATVMETIRELGLELQVIFNKGAVMVLPSGINKAAGLLASLDDLGLSPHNVVGIGDAENDHAFLDVCEFSVAVGNALPAVKDRCDHVTDGEDGDGVAELVDAILDDDLAGLDDRVRRHDLRIGTRDGDQPVTLRPHRNDVLVTGPSGSGKSTLTTAVLEQLTQSGYQFLLIDPEGDYDAFEGITVLGSPERVPTIDEALGLLRDPEISIGLNLLGIPLDDRPGFLAHLVPRLQELRAAFGRPHWLVVDEAHHLVPSGLQTTDTAIDTDVGSLLMVTVHADAMSARALEPIDVVITPAKGAEASLRAFAETTETDLPDTSDLRPGKHDAVAWFLPDPPFAFRPIEPVQDLKRHRRKYAQGDLEDDAFVFRGSEGRFELRAQNLQLFSQMAEGLDEETWRWHLERGDYEQWFREAIGDDELADVAKEVAEGDGVVGEGRRRILEAIHERYTLPAEVR